MIDLHPAALEHTGLAAALEQTARRLCRRADIRIDLEIDPSAAGACDEILFSLARELVTNAVKHAEGDQMAARVSREGERLILEVEDDGRGLAPGREEAALQDGHVGLASCRERVEALEGSFAVSSAPGRGTLVRVRLPITAVEDSSAADEGERPPRRPDALVAATTR